MTHYITPYYWLEQCNMEVDVDNKIHCIKVCRFYYENRYKNKIDILID